MAKLDETVQVRAADPRCDHATQTPHTADGSGRFFICQGCGAFIDYSKRLRGAKKSRALDAA